MSISPFSAHRASPEDESRRARLALAVAAIGIGATLLAYAISPGVRHAVKHAEHSVKHAVGTVFDPDHLRKQTHPRAKHGRLVQPLRTRGRHARPSHTHPPRPGATGGTGARVSGVTATTAAGG